MMQDPLIPVDPLTPVDPQAPAPDPTTPTQPNTGSMSTWWQCKRPVQIMSNMPSWPAHHCHCENPPVGGPATPVVPGSRATVSVCTPVFPSCISSSYTRVSAAASPVCTPGSPVQPATPVPPVTSSSTRVLQFIHQCHWQHLQFIHQGLLFNLHHHKLHQCLLQGLQLIHQFNSQHQFPQCLLQHHLLQFILQCIQFNLQCHLHTVSHCRITSSYS